MKAKAAPKKIARGSNPVDLHIGRRLRLRRIMVGLSQEELAAEIGIAFQQIQKYERALTRLSATRLWSMALALGCPVSFFYDGLKQACAGEGRDGPDSDESDDEDLGARPETLNLIRAYSAIKDPHTRRTFCALAESLGKTSEAAPRR